MFITRNTPASLAGCRPTEIAVFAAVFKVPLVSPMPSAVKVRAPGEIVATVNNHEVRLASVRRIEEIIDKQARSKGASRGECREMANEFFARLNGGCQ